MHEPTPTIDPNHSASEHSLPSNSFFSIEYPGYVRPQSVSLAISNLGGQSSLDLAFKRTATKSESLLELQLRPENPFAHPVPGDVVGTNNILVKVVKRKRRRLNAPEGEETVIGEYTAEAMGVIPKTVRFRSMVDYQYQADLDDPVAKLRLAMDTMNVDFISDYVMPEEREDYSLSENPIVDPQLAPEGAPEQTISVIQSNLRLFPPPLFTRQGISQNYNFKNNPGSIVSTTVDEDTGEETKRMINKSRWKGYGPASIVFTDPLIPDKPPVNVEKGRKQANERLLNLLKQTFEERPVWTRMSLMNQYSALDARDIHNSKVLLPLVCYVFQDGPWRDTLVRFGYDPRKDTNARFYQRLYFRNLNHPIARPSVITRRDGRAPNTLHAQASRVEAIQDEERRKSHIFDGTAINKETAAFQLCDLHDPMLAKMVAEEDDIRETCNDRDGWYSPQAFDRIKTVLRHKFFSLLEGHLATDDECNALLTSSSNSTGDPSSNKAKARPKKLQHGKHNMAKGALRPEDAAAVRLRATLDRNAKELHAQRGLE